MSKIKSVADLFILKGNAFIIGERLHDIRRQAEGIARQGKRQIAEDGEYAKLYASLVIDWVNDIAKVADLALDKMANASTRS